MNNDLIIMILKILELCIGRPKKTDTDTDTYLRIFKKTDTYIGPISILKCCRVFTLCYIKPLQKRPNFFALSQIQKFFFVKNCFFILSQICDKIGLFCIGANPYPNPNSKSQSQKPGKNKKSKIGTKRS